MRSLLVVFALGVLLCKLQAQAQAQAQARAQFYYVRCMASLKNKGKCAKIYKLILSTLK